ncbi:hypothetical protein L1F30_07060 [Simiduia sp. 21SJ11W-1]|uniref:hypothetical protein n=1 Tax=Simiduia sp. 21SJ11W-1 TaxID=2909669 RepID=UPI0020A12E03|nr:hypothetical protein [Simiduia sp. 21SJ11W-1]UTA49290.1 hypothetical protein L1F30_07060 [Simiduia sp. 21SJ11W-1]
MSATLFGHYLLDQGRISAAQHQAAIAWLRGKNKSLGALAIDSQLMSEKQVAELNRQQRNTDLMLGELAVKAGFLCETDLERLLILQQATRVDLPKALVALDILPQAEVALLASSFATEQKLSRSRCEALLNQVPQAELLQLCLNELIKSLQRICRQNVVVQMVHQQRELQKRLPYVVLQKLTGESPFHFGMALCAQQVQHISSSLSGEPAAQGYIPLAAMERFSDIVMQNACEKIFQLGREFIAEKPKAFFVGERIPACKNLVGIQLRSEEGDFDAVFFAS